MCIQGVQVPMDRNDRNHPSKQGCPSRGGIRRKPMTKSRMRRIGSGYQASVVWVTRPGTGMPDCHSEHHTGKSDAVREKKACLTSRDLQLCPEYRTTARATGRDGAGEVSRGHSSGSRLVVPREGPNLQMQGAVWEIRWVVSADNSAAPTGRRCHGAAARRNQPASFE